MVISPWCIQPIWQGCPLTLGSNPCSKHLLDHSDLSTGWRIQQVLGVGLGFALEINLQDSHPMCIAFNATNNDLVTFITQSGLTVPSLIWLVKSVHYLYSIWFGLTP